MIDNSLLPTVTLSDNCYRDGWMTVKTGDSTAVVQNVNMKQFMVNRGHFRSSSQTELSDIEKLALNR